MTFAILVTGDEPAVPPQIFVNEVERLPGRGEVFRSVEMQGGQCHALYGQAIPAGEDFFIASRPYPLPTCFEQFVAGRFQQGLRLFRCDTQCRGGLTR